MTAIFIDEQQLVELRAESLLTIFDYLEQAKQVLMSQGLPIFKPTGRLSQGVLVGEGHLPHQKALRGQCVLDKQRVQGGAGCQGPELEGPGGR